MGIGGFAVVGAGDRALDLQDAVRQGLTGGGDPVVGQLVDGVGGSDVDDDDRDVVAAARGDRAFDQIVGGFLRRLGRHQDVVDLVLVDLVEQSIAAEDVAVAHHGHQLPRVDQHPLVDAEGAGDDVALRMHGGFGSGQPTVAHQRFDEAVILGVLMQAVVGSPVEAAVADVGDAEPIGSGPLEIGEDRDRRAHAFQLGLEPAAVDDLGVGLLHPLDQVVDRGDGGRRGERVDRDRRCDLAPRVATHAVGHREHRIVGEHLVLVVAPDLAGVGRRAEFEAGHTSSMT